MTRSWIIGVVGGAFALASLTGCPKKEEPAEAAPAPAPEPAPAPAPEPAAEAPAAAADDLGGDVKRYPGETPMSGTVRIKVPFNIYNEADLNSKKLGGVAARTHVDLKASFSNWMLIMWPSGVGELSPGWIQLPNIHDKRVEVDENPPERTARPKLQLRKPPAGRGAK